MLSFMRLPANYQLLRQRVLVTSVTNWTSSSRLELHTVKTHLSVWLGIAQQFAVLLADRFNGCRHPGV